ncbi:MAG: TIM barrel protein [Christensenellaceae bacterium]|nr:TIM barrel protein [Christensenellaceae bacterium]
MVKISAFPKCWLEDICEGRMSLEKWIDLSVQLECDGLEMYSGFLPSLEPAELNKIRRRVEALGMEIPMLCYSPDFTQPQAEARAAEVEKQKIMIRATAELGGKYCRVLSGQRRPEVSEQQGVQWVAECITACLEEAEKQGVVLAMENHYKDGYWKYPEFAQKEAVFLQIVNRIDSPWFGVQFDPSNSIVAGEDPLSLLKKVSSCVRTMHASDRYIDGPVTQEEVFAYAGKEGYHPALKHGEVGKGLNDYPEIFRQLAEAGFDGWISIEDGMNGMDEMKRSIDYLKKLRTEYFG